MHVEAFDEYASPLVYIGQWNSGKWECDGYTLKGESEAMFCCSCRTRF